jgi:hypothetical protein
MRQTPTRREIARPIRQQLFSAQCMVRHGRTYYSVQAFTRARGMEMTWAPISKLRTSRRTKQVLYLRSSNDRNVPLWNSWHIISIPFLLNGKS